MAVRGMQRRWLGAALLAAAMAGVVVANATRDDDKGGAADVIPVTYVGELGGAPGSARIAFVVEGDKFVAYVCSGDKAFDEGFSRWFRGDIAGGKLAVTADGIDLAAALTDDGVTGTLKNGVSHAFAAKAVAGDADAGLFRAAESFGDDDVIFGWIKDEKGEIVGTAGKKNGKVQTLPAAKGTGNISGTVNGKKVAPGKVAGAGPAAKASPPGKKFDVAARAEFLKDLVDQRKAEGGNVVQAMVLNQVRRFVAGRQAATPLEVKTFAALRKAPGDTLQKYLKDWDKLPIATRQALLGPAAGQLNEDVGLDAAAARQLVSTIPQVAALRTPKAGGTAPAQGTVKAVNITTVKCVDETNPESFGSDEVFALHAVVVGSTGPVFKQTGILREFDDGVTQLFPQADKGVFPLPGLVPTAGAEVTVVTTLFEDDGAVLIQVLNLVKPLVETAAVIVLEAVAVAKGLTLDEATKEALKAGVKGVVEGAITSLGSLLVQPLGTDVIVVRPNGTVVGTTGAAKTKMSFRRVKNGDVKHDYELFGFDVQK